MRVIDRQTLERVDDIPDWGFDGSSTLQAEGSDSDCVLRPVHYCNDPIRGYPHILVMCEVLNRKDKTPHKTNTHRILAEAVKKYGDQKPLFGFEQEYFFYKNGWPLGWPAGGYPEPQGKYYCGVGASYVKGRQIVEAHRRACMEAHLGFDGLNAEVALAQWEFQTSPLEPLRAAHELWLMRRLLILIAEDYDVDVNFDSKPIQEGDWNGSGGHTNFSTANTRENIEYIFEACRKLSKCHEAHIRVYGKDNDKRLTGKHETCSIHLFRAGVSDRGASVRIPMATTDAGKGYLEDRRPAANADPYLVFAALLETVCGSGFDPSIFNKNIPAC